jgi:outer membrane protein assembly factor BamA
MKHVVMLLILAAAVVPAQSRRAPKKADPVPAAPAPASNPDSWPLDRIEIQGLHNVTREQVLAITGLHPGQMADKKLLEAAHERLMASGGFETVGYEFKPAPDSKGVILTYDLVEVNAFYPVMFEDIPVADAELRAYLKSKDPLFGPKISATKEALEHYKQELGEFLATKNFHEPLDARLSSENPPDLVILIRPATQRAVIAQVKAVNTGEIDAGVVQSTMYGVGVGTVYSEPRVRQLLDSSIRPLYEAKGHLRVAFPKISSTQATDVKGLIVTVEVDQGPVFNFGKVWFAGTDTAADELENLVKLKSGNLANFDQVKAAQSNLEDYFKHKGYLQARTEAIRAVDDAQKTVDLTFRIVPGPQFTFHTLTIQGLDIIGEPVVRKMWGLKEGAPFNPDYADHFLARVKEEGLFDNLGSTSSERQIDSDKHTVDVTLYFKGARADAESRRKRQFD